MADNRAGKPAGPRSLDQPLDRSSSWRINVDQEGFGRISERVARYIGSWNFIAWMTVVIILWLAWNSLAPEDLQPDPFPFIFLTLLLSLQASYAAPLILLAQNRQDDRDRVQYGEDRARTDRLIADTEYLARELASMRSNLGETASRDYVRGEVRELKDMLEQIAPTLERLNGYMDRAEQAGGGQPGAASVRGEQDGSGAGAWADARPPAPD